MKRFVFRLEPVLNYKIHQERMAQLEVAKARTALQACEAKIMALMKDANETARDLEDRIHEGISMDQYRFYTNYLSSMDRLIENEKERQSLLVKQLADKQNQLRQKTIDKKTLEILKEKQRETYYQDANVFFQKEADDMVTIRQKREP